MSWAQDHGYGWLEHETSPRIAVEAIKLLGIKEVQGPGDNPTILEWAKKLGVYPAYNHDSIPWCGLGMAYIAKQAGWEPPKDFLWALNWQHFGNAVPLPMFGDIMVKHRTGGAHVTMYVGEDTECYHCIGANQSDMVDVVRYPRSVFTIFRRCPWRINQPVGVRRILLSANGTMATKEN